MEIPGLGLVTKDERFGWYSSQPVSVSMLNGKECRIVIEGYEQDLNKKDFHIAISNFLSGLPSVLKEVEGHIYQYYLDIKRSLSPSEEKHVSIHSPSDVWAHIQLGEEPVVSRRFYGDEKVYISIECNCEWEPEHGLQIVVKNGESVCKIGPYDGHLTNSDAFANASLENVIYHSLA